MLRILPLLMTRMCLRGRECMDLLRSLMFAETVYEDDNEVSQVLALGTSTISHFESLSESDPHEARSRDRDLLNPCEALCARRCLSAAICSSSSARDFFK